jgi:hypothetical protein
LPAIGSNYNILFRDSEATYGYDAQTGLTFIKDTINRLDIDGKISISNLTGDGERMVTVTADGVLASTNISINDDFGIINKNASDVFEVDLNDYLNFLLNCAGVYSIDVTVNSQNIGQTGTIIIKNTSITNPSSLPSNLKTPNGYGIDWNTGSGEISLISYIVIDVNTVLVNYVGNFQ